MRVIAPLALGAAVLGGVALTVGGIADREATMPRWLRAEVVRSYPHDPGAFTQGLVLDGSTLFESTGLYGQSTLRRIDLATGRVITAVMLADDHFGEGLALAPGALVQLTWQNGLALEYDPRTLEPRRSVRYAGEGWGLCYDGRAFVMSDGTDRLTFRRPDTFEVERTIHVRLNGEPLRNLNELECVGDSIYANVWHRDVIVRVNATDGRVIERIDASGLLAEPERQAADVLNGIAYDPSDGLFLLTGKLWPRLFRVRFVDAP